MIFSSWVSLDGDFDLVCAPGVFLDFDAVLALPDDFDFVLEVAGVFLRADADAPGVFAMLN